MIKQILHIKPLLKVSLLVTAITLAFMASANITQAADSTCLDISGSGQEILVNGVANSGVLKFDSPYEPAESEKACMRDVSGTTPNTYQLEGWVWNEELGWTSLYCGADGLNQGLACGSIEYGVTVDIDDGEFHGYAWNDATGWITFNCADDTGGCTVDNTHVVKMETDPDCVGLIYSTNTYATPANCPAHTEADAFAWSNSVGWMDLSGVQLPLGLTVSAINPSVGPTAGGTSVTITGTGFENYSTIDVTIGGSACSGVTVNSPTELTCTTTAHTAGLANVQVTLDGTTSASLVNGFEYTAPNVTVNDISPNEGPASGGTFVTITGSGFENYSTVDVQFGGTSCTDIEVDSSTEIDCVTAAHTAGSVDVSVILDGVPTTVTNGFTYRDTGINGIFPDSGPRAGGTFVTISGYGFTYSSTVDVQFGGISCTDIEVDSVNEIDCVTPAHVAGTVDVDVILDGVTTTYPQGFTYDDTQITVQTLGDGLSDYTLTTNPVDLIFSEAVPVADQPIVEAAINAGSSRLPLYSWSPDDTTLTITPTDTTVWSNDVWVWVGGTQLRLIDSALEANQMPFFELTTVSSTTPNVVVMTPDAGTINIPVDVSQSYIDLSSILTNGSGVIGEITINAQTANNSYVVSFADQVDLTGETGWDELIYAPFEIDASGYNDIPVEAADVSGISIGSDTHGIEFSKGVRLEIDDKAGYTIGFYEDDTFTEVTSPCDEDTQAIGDALGAGEACYIDVDDDLILWTKHFTDVITYTTGVSPTVTNVLPSQGNEAGGTKVTITGTNFGTGAVAGFGGTDALSTYVVDNTTILAETPAGTGTVDVTVTNTDTNSGTLASGFEYVATADPAGPALDAVTPITPATGATAGGDSVTITGTNFTDPTSVYFGSSAGTGISYDSSTQLSGTTPAHASGAVDLIVIDSNGQWDMATDAFTYTGGSGGCGTVGPNQQCGSINVEGTVDIWYDGYGTGANIQDLTFQDGSCDDVGGSSDNISISATQEIPSYTAEHCGTLTRSDIIGVTNQRSQSWNLQVQANENFVGPSGEIIPISGNLRIATTGNDANHFGGIGTMTVTNSTPDDLTLTNQTTDNIWYYTPSNSSYTYAQGDISAPLNTTADLQTLGTYSTEVNTTGITILSTDQTDAYGIFTIAPVFELDVPPGSAAVTYTNTIVYTVT